jgi:hypothetical protein
MVPFRHFAYSANSFPVSRIKSWPAAIFMRSANVRPFRVRVQSFVCPLLCGVIGPRRLILQREAIGSRSQ